MNVRDINLVEVADTETDKCDVCLGAKCASSGPTAFIFGVITGLSKSDFVLCSTHYKNLLYAIEKLAAKVSKC